MQCFSPLDADESLPVPPVVHCVRHAQGVHNLSFANHNIFDPPLTPHGEEQCRHLCLRFPYHSSIELLCSSPLLRTLQTTILSFSPEIGRGMKIVALPDAQETAKLPCDTGKDAQELARIMRDKPVDLGLVEEGWNSKRGRYGDDPESLKNRARDLRRWLKARPEKELVLVTHGGFLHWLTEDWTNSGKFSGTGWANTEFRSYRFVDEPGDNASLIETTASRDLRRGTEKPLTETEQLELARTAQKPSTNGASSPAR